MAKPHQTTSELSRALAGKWTKTEKRAEASRQIAASKEATHRILKEMRQHQARLKF